MTGLNHQSQQSLFSSVGAMVPLTVQKGWAKHHHNALRNITPILLGSTHFRRRKRELLLALWAGLFILVLYLLHSQMHSGFRIAEAVGYTQPEEKGPIIPRKIWQVFLTKPNDQGTGPLEINPDVLTDTPSWLAKNPDYTYKLVGSTGADKFVIKHFAKNRSLVETFLSLSNYGLRSDILRYLILLMEGGVYSDTDTTCFRSIDEWVPPEYRDRARLVVGIEFDRLDGPYWADIPHELQFCQWTIAAAPGHPVFARMVQRAITSLKEIVRGHNITMPLYHPSSFEVMNSTGPAAWTDAVFEELQIRNPNLTTVRDLSGMTKPRLIGDILILPIDGFGMGQPHSNSTNDGTVPQGALIRHNFHGSWREPEPEKEESEEEKAQEEHGEEEHNEEQHNEEEHQDAGPQDANPQEEESQEQEPLDGDSHEEKEEEEEPEDSASTASSRAKEDERLAEIFAEMSHHE